MISKAINILEDLARIHEHVNDLKKREKEKLGELLDRVYASLVGDVDVPGVPKSLRDLSLNTIDMFQGLRLVLDHSYNFEHWHRI